MKTCEEFQAIIVDLQELDPDKRSALESHAETCPGCRAKLDEYQRVMEALRGFGAPLHVDGERLTRFALHRAAPAEPDYDQTRLSGEEIQQIEGHVSECPRCRLTVESILEQYREMDRFLGEVGVPVLPIDRPSLWVFARQFVARVSTRAKNALIQRPSYITAAVALGSLIVVLWVGPWLRDPYHRLAFVEATETSFLTRDTSSALSQGISLMNEGRYAEAIALLEPVAAGDGEADDRLQSYAHYLSGLAWVYEARTEIFGRVLAYNEVRLDRAIEHLRTVTQSNQSGRVLEDAWWYLGKAYLMRQDAPQAIEAFGEVAELDGRRAADARTMIQAVAAID